MSNIFEKVGSIGAKFAESVKDTMKESIKDEAKSSISSIGDSISSSINKLKKNTGFVVEKFASVELLQDDLNKLQDKFDTVEVQSMCQIEGGYIAAVIKIVD